MGAKMVIVSLECNEVTCGDCRFHHREFPDMEDWCLLFRDGERNPVSLEFDKDAGLLRRCNQCLRAQVSGARAAV